MMISSSCNYHWVKNVSASTHGGGVLKLTLRGKPDASDMQFNEAEINVFLDDADLTAKLIEAINGVSRESANLETEAA